MALCSNKLARERSGSQRSHKPEHTSYTDHCTLINLRFDLDGQRGLPVFPFTPRPKVLKRVVA